MAIRDKMAANAQPLLEPGEQIQAIAGAQSKTGWLGGISALILMFVNRYQMIVATDRRIAVLDCGKFQMTKPKSVLRSFNRSTQIGPASGLWWKCETLGEKMYVHKRFHKDIQQADAFRPTGPPPAQAWQQGAVPPPQPQPGTIPPPPPT